MIVGELIDRCLNTFLLGTYSSQYSSLQNAVDATQVEFDCALPLGEVSPGAFVAVDDELVYVYDRDDTNNRFLATRGVRGTEAATHRAGTALEVNPRFPHFLVRTAMVEEIDSWPDNLYCAKTFATSLASLAGTIEVPDVIDEFETMYPIRVRRASLSTTDDRVRRTSGWDTARGVDDATTIALDAVEGQATNYLVTVACRHNSDKIGEFGDGTELTDDVGLTRGMFEILELGACWRLLTARAGVRLFPEAEGQSRAPAEVGAHDITVLANALLGLRERAISRETARLVKRWGFAGD